MTDERKTCDDCGLGCAESTPRRLYGRTLCGACYYVQGAAEVAQILDPARQIDADGLRAIGIIRAELAEIDSDLTQAERRRWAQEDRRQD